jgi:phage/plasmid-like protein (TIGR03299 family)
MSHEIVSAVFSAREGAGWTGLGQVIPADAAKDPRKIAELVGATYTIDKRQTYFKDATGTLRAIPNREVLVRSDTGAALEVVSENRYHVTNRQPADILEAFRDELAKESLEMSHVAVLSGGSRIAACAYLPEDLDTVVGKSDRVKNYVTLSTGYDGKNGTIATSGTERVVCANTLAMSIIQAQESGKIRTIRASTEIYEAATLAQLLKDCKTRLAIQSETFNKLANTSMSSDQVARFFADVLKIDISKLGTFNKDGTKAISTKSQNMLRELASAYSSAPGAGMAAGTAWGALNAVTYYATHVKTIRDMSGSGENAARVASNLNGDAEKLKLRALQLAAQSFAVAA